MAGRLKSGNLVEDLGGVHTGYKQMSFRILLGKLLNKFVRSYLRRNVMEKVNGEVTEVRMLYGSTWIACDIFGLINRVLDGTSGGQEGELTILNGDETIIIRLQQSSASAAKLELLNAFVQSMGGLWGIRIRLLHTKWRQQMALTSRHIVVSALIGRGSASVVVNKVAVQYGVLLRGTIEKGQRKISTNLWDEHDDQQSELLINGIDSAFRKSA